MAQRRNLVSLASALLAVAYLLCDATPAEAYIDPGSGSLAFQVILTTALGAVVFVRRLRARILAVARRLFGRTTDAASQKPE